MTKNTQSGLRDRAIQEALSAIRQASPGISAAIDALAAQAGRSASEVPASDTQPMPTGKPDEGEGTEGRELCESPDGHPAHSVQKPQKEIAPPVELHRTQRRAAFDRKELARSVVMAEVLGKPVALRRGGRML